MERSATWHVRRQLHVWFYKPLRSLRRTISFTRYPTGHFHIGWFGWFGTYHPSRCTIWWVRRPPRHGEKGRHWHWNAHRKIAHLPGSTEYVE